MTYVLDNRHAVLHNDKRCGFVVSTRLSLLISRNTSTEIYAMAYPIAIGDVVEFIYKAKLHGQTVMNVFHYKSLAADADGQGILTGAAALFGDVVVTPIQTIQSNMIVNAKIQAQIVHPVRYQPITIAAPSDEGLDALTCGDTGHAVVVRRKGDLATRQNQGRIFIPGYPNSKVVAGQVSPVDAAALAAIGDAMKLQLEDMLSTFILAPILFNLALPVLTREVTYASVDSVVRYQRRREVGVGI